MNKQDILSQVNKIWSGADILRGRGGWSENQWSGLMMPYVALMVLESRLERLYDELKTKHPNWTHQDITQEIRDSKPTLINHIALDPTKNNIFTLKDLAKQNISQSDVFYNDFTTYLNAWSPEIKQLLGVGTVGENFLDIENKSKAIKAKGFFYEYLTEVYINLEFKQFNNSDITTFEEHIKRKWADASAEESGEQYTPDDVINLIYEICATKIKMVGDKVKDSISIYDMTCGGGNMLFGVEDKIREKHTNATILKYGQELKDHLYALAKIEGFFRDEKGFTNIQHGDTLINDKFGNKKYNPLDEMSGFDFIIANPPYGIDWKSIKKQIENDKTGRFIWEQENEKMLLPTTSDGQMLFLQHALSKLNKRGLACVVTSGSPFFNGDAGSGESEIRRKFLENDWISAIIQLPTNEFFNTGITTYIWILDKNKVLSQKNKILCINAENIFTKLKKNKGSKTKEINSEQAKQIASIFDKFEESDISKVVSKYDFYYNKQLLKKLEKDEIFNAVDTKLNDIKIIDANKIEISFREGNTTFESLNINDINESNLKSEVDRINTILKDLDNNLMCLKIICNQNSFYLDQNHCVIKVENEKLNNLGYGDIKVKVLYKKQTTKTKESIIFDITIEPIWIKDEERIKYNPNNSINMETVQEFIKKWVSSNSNDVQLLDNAVGTEINFNTIFPKVITIRSSKEILKEITIIDEKLKGFYE